MERRSVRKAKQKRVEQAHVVDTKDATPPLTAEPPRPRRALSQQPGEVHGHGEPRVSETLREMLRAASEADPDTLTHGFHTYPGRLHPAIAQFCIERYGAPAHAGGRDSILLDPFCGSGTVLVEAVAQGRTSVGIDLNPLAVRLAEIKTWLWTSASKRDFLQACKGITERSLERVQSRTPIVADLPATELAWYEPHVLKELAGLFEEIRQLPRSRNRSALEMVFSSMVVKFSRQRADTSQEVVAKRIRKGLASEFFARKASELAARLDDLRATAPRHATEPTIAVQDMRHMGRVLPRPASLVITSPPYVGTYDYVSHHERRFAWLGIRPSQFERSEIGARRTYSRPEVAAPQLRAWHAEFGRCLQAIAQATEEGAKIFLVMGDGQIGKERVDMLRLVQDLAPRVELRFVAAASEPRSDWYTGSRNPHRNEYLMALENVRDRPSQKRM